MLTAAEEYLKNMKIKRKGRLVRSEDIDILSNQRKKKLIQIMCTKVWVFL